MVLLRISDSPEAAALRLIEKGIVLGGRLGNGRVPFRHLNKSEGDSQMTSFYQWLGKQTERDDIIGDFAHTMQQFDEPTTTRKKANPHMIWATWLVDKNASPKVIEAFNKAWTEYQNLISA